MITPLFKKLRLSPNLDEILILNEPSGFDRELNKLSNIRIIESLVKVSEVDFALVFVTKKDQIEKRIETLYPRLIGDATLWFAYPKKNSKIYTTKLTRKNGWGVLGDYLIKPVQKISIDHNWNALRFRKLSFIS
ncbi:hypothetical protein [Aquimarina rhabdastrellae]